MPRFAKANKHVLFLEHNLTNHKTRKNNILTLIDINKKYTSDVGLEPATFGLGE